MTPRLMKDDLARDNGMSGGQAQRSPPIPAPALIGSEGARDPSALLHQGDVPDAVAECLDAVSELMDEKLEALAKGEIG